MTHKLVGSQARVVDFLTTHTFVGSQDREVDALRTHAGAMLRAWMVEALMSDMVDCFGERLPQIRPCSSS